MFYLKLFFGFLVIVLLLRIFLYFSSIKPFTHGEKVDFSFILLTEPTISGKFQRFSAAFPGKERIFITTPSYPRYFYGQELHIQGVVKRQKLVPKNRDNVSTSGVFLLRTENVINTIFFPKIEAKDISYLSALGSLRKNLITIFSSSLSPASESLLLGIVFGIRSGMPKDLAGDLSATGVIHITAASGMNVTMVAGAVFFLLSGFLRRQVAIIVGVLLIWTYALLAGLEPSILRASIMSSFVFGAGLLGRQNTTLIALFFTSCLMLIFDPSLVISAGFLLSCFSTLGIVLFGQVVGIGQSLVDPLQQRETESFVSAFRQDVQTTIAAQAGTLPILFIYFGQYNLLSILVNVLILWTIPILMILGSIAAISGLVLRPLATPVLFLTLPLLSYIELVVKVFAKYPVFLQLQHVSIVFVIGYYCLFFSIYLFFRSKRS